jgi:iron complex outermembrane receptor protein
MIAAVFPYSSELTTGDGMGETNSAPDPGRADFKLGDLARWFFVPWMTMRRCQPPRKIYLAVVLGGAIVTGALETKADSTSGPMHSDPLVVTATRIEQSEFDLPFSIDSIGRQNIHDQQPRVNLSESLVRVPGVVAQPRQNYAQDVQISIRGFGARASFGIRGIRLLADGIPATMPDGQGQAATFGLDSAQRIEVLRGPFSALYGNASGGVIQMFSAEGSTKPTVEAGLLTGSFGTTRVGVKTGGEQGSLNTLITGSRFDSDGYRDHSAVTRDTASTRLRWRTAAGTRVTLLADTLHQRDTQDPLGLTRAMLEQDPRQAGSGAESFNTRKSIGHAQVGLTLEQRPATNTTLAFTGYGGQRDVRQYLAFAGAGPTQSGGVVDLDRGFYGLGVRWTQRLSLAEQPLTLTLGADHNDMAERRRGFVNDNGVVGDLRRDEDDRVYDLDQYMQLEWHLAPRWHLSAGLRHSRVVFDSKDYYITGPSNPDDSGGAVYEKTNPMLGWLFAWRETVNFYINAGQGFETPTFAELAYRSDGSAGLNFALRPSVSRNLEAGIKAYVGSATRVNAALFRIRAKDEIVAGPAPAPGRLAFMNAPRTARDGIELSIDSHLGHDVQAYLACTYLDARFEDYVNFSGVSLSGKPIPGVPRTTLYGELRWRPIPGMLTVLEARRLSAIPVDDANTDTAAAYTVLNWRIGWEKTGRGWRVGPYLRIDNLLDKNYVGSVIVNANNGAYFEPAPRRYYTLGLQAHLEL